MESIRDGTTSRIIKITIASTRMTLENTDRAPGLCTHASVFFESTAAPAVFAKYSAHRRSKSRKRAAASCRAAPDPANERIRIFDNQYTDHSDDCDLDPVDIYDMLQPPDLRMVF